MPGELDLGWRTADVERAADGLAREVLRRSIEIVHIHYAVPFCLVADGLRRRLGASCPAIVGTLHGTT